MKKVFVLTMFLFNMVMFSQSPNRTQQIEVPKFDAAKSVGVFHYDEKKGC